MIESRCFSRLEPRPTISVVTPTLDRPDEVRALLVNLCAQRHPPCEVVIVDGAPEGVEETARAVEQLRGSLPWPCKYLRHGGGTAVQRNVGIDAASGEFIAFVDDDMLLEPDFLEVILRVFREDHEGQLAAVAGYITNQHLNPRTSRRWKWYRRLHLFSTYEPGAFDIASGYPINRYLQPPHDGVREIDVVGAGCAVWRRKPFDDGLRFSPFFVDYGVMEDAHLALTARRRGWRICECGSARCVHMHSPRGRTNGRRIAKKSAVNYRFLFVDIVPHRTLRQECRFWLVQCFDLFRQAAWAARHPSSDGWSAVLGKLEGIVAATRVRPGTLLPP